MLTGRIVPNILHPDSGLGTHSLPWPEVVSDRSVAQQNAYLFIAGEAINSFKIVTTNSQKVIYANSDTADNENSILGISISTADIDEEVTVVTSGLVTNPAWSFTTVRAPLYLNGEGDVSETAPLTGFSRMVGFVYSATQMIFTSASGGGGGGGGSQGPQGFQGIQGAQGSQGFQGVIGPQGIDGSDINFGGGSWVRIAPADSLQFISYNSGNTNYPRNALTGCLFTDSGATNNGKPVYYGVPSPSLTAGDFVLQYDGAAWEILDPRDNYNKILGSVATVGGIDTVVFTFWITKYYAVETTVQDFAYPQYGNVKGPETHATNFIPLWDNITPNNLTLIEGVPVPAGGLAGITALSGKKYYHGIEARPILNNPVPKHISTGTFTLSAATTNVAYWYQGERVLVTSNKSDTLDEGAGLYFVTFVTNTGNISVSKSFGGIGYTSPVIIAVINWDGTNYGLVNDERHNHTRNHSWHEWAHSTVGVRYQEGIALTHNSGTGAAATFATTAGVLWDEDIKFAVPASSAFPTANAGRILYQTSATSCAFLDTTSTVPAYLGANSRPNYVLVTDYSLVEMTSAVNRYVNIFVYATLDLHTPIYFVTETLSATVAGTNGYTSVTNARSAPFPNLSAYGLSPEMKPIYRLIMRADGVLQPINTTLDDYRTVSSLPMSAGLSASTASGTSFTPTTYILSTNVQGAVEEVDTKARVKVLTFVFDGGGAVVAADSKAFIRVPYACTITKVTLLADQTGTAAVDVWRDTYANYPPTVADTIVSSAIPTITSAIKYENSTLTGWTKTINAGDILGADVDVCTTCTRLTLEIEVVL